MPKKTFRQQVRSKKNKISKKRGLKNKKSKKNMRGGGEIIGQL